MARWQKILYASWVAQMFSIIGFSASIPFLPLYLVKVLHIPTSQEAGLWAGFMAFLSAAMMAVFAPVWGYLADRYGRRKMVLRAMISGSVLIFLMAFTQNVWILLFLRMAQGALTGTVPANVALVASTTPKNRTGYALGLLQTAVFVGASVGPLLGGFFADQVGYTATFYITAIMLALAAIIVYFFVHEDFVPVVADKREAMTVGQRIREAFISKTFVVMIVVLALVQFGGAVIAPVLALFIQDLNGTTLNAATWAGAELGITGVALAISSVFAGKLSDRFGYRPVLVISSFAGALLYFPQAFVTNVTQLLVLRALMGLCLGGIVPSANALIAQMIPGRRKGSAYGIVSMFNSFGFAIGPITGAIIAAALDIRAVFLLTASVMLIAACAVFVALKPQPRPAQTVAETAADAPTLRPAPAK